MRAAPQSANADRITCVGGGVIWEAQADGTGRHMIVPAGWDGLGDPAWSRDGTRLAFYGRYSDSTFNEILRSLGASWASGSDA